MEHGNIRVLIQPAELLIIGGATAGTILIANPFYIVKNNQCRTAGGALKGSKFTNERYPPLRVLFFPSTLNS